jgi:hypothetical protein
MTLYPGLFCLALGLFGLALGLSCLTLTETYAAICSVPAWMNPAESGLTDMAQMCKDWQELLARQVQVERMDLNPKP